MNGRRILCLVGLLAGLVRGPLQAKEEPAWQNAGIITKVGQLGDVRELEIRGAKTFTPEQIKDALNGNWDVTLAGHPSATISQYVRTLREKVAAGYRNEGFPKPQVEVTLDPGSHRFVVTVEEGPRFMRGEIRVRGAKQIPVDRLQARLTEPYLPRRAVAVTFTQVGDKLEPKWVDREGKGVEKEDPVWQPGEPASFAQVRHEQLSKQVAFALADLGFYFADFNLAVVPRKGEPLADLTIDVVDEGCPGALGRIEITGNRINSDREILKYIGLKPGGLFDRNESVRVSQRLWKSGRFVEFDVTPQGATPGEDSLWLKINVMEYAEAPPLGKPLSREERVLLKLRDWLANTENWQSDLVFTVRRQRDGPVDLEMAVSPEGGLSLLFRESAREPDFDWAFVARGPEAGVYSGLRRRKLENLQVSATFTGSIGLGMAKEPDDAERPYRQRITVGFGIRSREAETDPPFCLSTELDPCYFLALAHEHNAKCRFRDGILTVATEDAKWQVDANSGRLVEWRAVEGNARLPEPGMRITWEKNGLGKRVRQIQAAAKGSPNDFNPKYPIGSFLAFVCREKALWERFGLDATGIRAMHLASYAFEAGLLNPLEESREDDGEEEEPDGFSIPADLKSLEGLSPEEILLSKEFWSRIAVRSADELFPRNSWPWTVWRETALALGGNGKYADEELAKLCASPNNGPICFLLVATMLDEVNPQAAARVARLGIARLSLDDFRNDYRVLFDGRYMAGKCALHLAKVLQTMDEAGVAAIGESLTRRQRALLRRMVDVLRKERGKPIEKSLATALDEMWESGLREIVKQRLENVAVGTPGYSAVRNDEKAAIAEIERLGGWVKVDESRPEKPVEYVNLAATLVTDAGLAQLKRLSKFKRLDLSCTKVTDAGLIHLKSLMNLEGLDLGSTQVTDAGLMHLKSLTNLEGLYLRGTQVTDARLVHLKGLAKLEALDLEQTQVTDAGLEDLRGLTNLERLDLTGTQVTGPGDWTARPRPRRPVRRPDTVHTVSWCAPGDELTMADAICCVYRLAQAGGCPRLAGHSLMRRIRPPER